MFDAPPLPPQVQTTQPRTGLAIASLVIGILAVFSSILVVGAFAGLLAILLGAIHISKRRGPNGMAWAGIGLSVLSITISAGVVVLSISLLKSSKSNLSEWVEPAETAVETVDPVFADWIGEAAPEFTLTSLDGETFRSHDLRGRRVVLDFWATWCPACRREVPHFVQLAEENPRSDLLIIGISSEDEGTLREFIEQEEVNYPIVSTEEVPPPFDSILSVPTTFIIDRNGIIQQVLEGYHDYEHLKELALADDLPASMEASGNNQP